MRLVGRPIPRVEDARILRGRATYLDDIEPPGTLHAGFVRSPYPHARVLRVDMSDALSDPRVIAGYTSLPGPPMAPGGKVRFQGEAVAMLVAVDRYALADALERVVVDYEPLPHVVDPAKALEEGAPLLHEENGSNVAHTARYGSPDAAGAAAPRVLEGELRVQRVVPAAMEPRGVVAAYDGHTLTVWSSTQVPYDVRKEVAGALGLPLSRVRAVQPDVGGAFGSKLIVYPEEVWVAAAAYLLGRPVKWVATRSEDFRATTHGRDMGLAFRVGFDGSGRVRSLWGRITCDVGAYHWGEGLSDIAARMLTGPYDIREAGVEVVDVYTNKTPLGAYRGAGRPEATFFVERIMDMVADELGLDPVEVRRANLVRGLPYTNPFGMTYDTGDYTGTLEAALSRLGYYELLRWADEEWARGRLVGVGLSIYVEVTTFGFETAIVRAEPDGSFTVVTGTTPHGQGVATGIAQIVADELEVPLESVRVVWGDTALVQDGIGTMGSRSITAGGSAALLAARRLREGLKAAAEQLLGSPVQYSGGRFWGPNGEAQIGDVVRAIYRGRASGPLEAYEVYNARSTYPFGVHVAVVEVDPETGHVRPVLYRSYDDAGEIVNPLLAEGQIHGGVLQGVGQALYEEAVYDGEGNLITANLALYGVPTFAEAPRYEVRFAERPHRSEHPTGTKGVGEIGAIAATPAVVRAVEHAVRRVRPGARATSTPLTPEKVWMMLRP